MSGWTEFSTRKVKVVQSRPCLSVFQSVCLSGLSSVPVLFSRDISHSTPNKTWLLGKRWHSIPALI